MVPLCLAKKQNINLYNSVFLNKKTTKIWCNLLNDMKFTNSNQVEDFVKFLWPELYQTVVLSVYLVVHAGHALSWNYFIKSMQCAHSKS